MGRSPSACPPARPASAPEMGHDGKNRSYHSIKSCVGELDVGWQVDDARCQARSMQRPGCSFNCPGRGVRPQRPPKGSVNDGRGGQMSRLPVRRGDDGDGGLRSLQEGKDGLTD